MFKIPWSCSGILIVKAVSCLRYRTKYVRNSQLRDSWGNRLCEETQPSAGRKAESKGKAVEDVWKGKFKPYEDVSFRTFPLFRCCFREQQSFRSTKVCFTFCTPVPLHRGPQCRHRLGRIMLLAFNKYLLSRHGM